MKRVKYVSEKLSTGELGEKVPIGADAENIDLANGKNVESAIGEINSKITSQEGNISGLTNRISTAESDIENLQRDVVEKAPTNHASSSLTYGGGTSSSYGHVKLTDAYNSATGTADSSIGASQKAVNSAHTDLNTKIGTLSSLTTSTKTNLVVAVNEVDKNADAAQSTATAANSTATTANNTANANKTNIGTLSSLTTDSKTNLVAAINEVDKNANTAKSTADSAKSTATTANNTANTANSTANTNKTSIGTLTSLTTDAKTNLVGAINEVDAHANSASSAASTAQSTATTAKSTADSALSIANTAKSTANTNKTSIGTLSSLTTTAKTNLVVAINEVDANANAAQSTATTAKSTADSAKSTATTANNTANTNKTNIGTLTGLTTSTKTSLVAAINEVDKNVNTAQSTATTASSTATTANNTANTNKTNIGTLSSLKTAVKTNIVNSINSLYDNTIGKTLKTLDEIRLATHNGYYADALAVKELDEQSFKCNWYEFNSGEGTWRPSSTGVTRTLDQPITNFKMIGFLVINTGSDGKSHRIIQWFPVKWLETMIPGSSAATRQFLFNFSRTSDKRVWVRLVPNSYNKFTFVNISGDTESYNLVIWGLK